MLERRLGELHLVLVADLGALDQADRRQRDVDDIELLGERLDDAPESIVATGLERIAQVRAHQLEPALAEVGHRREPGDLELRPRGRLDVAQQSMLARLDQRDRHALASGPARSTDAMHVGIGVGRHVEVDDVADMVDVEAAGGDVRRDQHVQRAVAETPHDPVAGLLGEAAVEGAGVVATAAQRLGQVVHLAARPREHERGRRILDVEDAAERRQLVDPPHDVGRLADAGHAVAGASSRRGP